MPGRCDICGIEALESQEFQQERLPFRRPKRYCPACRSRFYNRIYLVLFLIPLLFASLALIAALRRSTPLLQSREFQIACVLLLQWLMILPHELGHAALARFFGYNQIRILIGSGKQLFSAKFFGFAWLFNLIPFGGLTLFAPSSKISRWKHVVIVAAGPMVNLCLATAALLAARPASPLPDTASFPNLLCWANVVVLASSLFPHVAQTSFGPVPTDGLQLWHLLFRWNKPVQNQPQPVPLWELLLSHCLKWFIFLITLTTCLLLGAIAVGVLFWSNEMMWPARIFLAVVVSSLSLVSGWITWRVAVDPIAKVRKPIWLGGAFPFGPEQIHLIKKANDQLARHEFQAAADTFSDVLSSIPDHNSGAFNQVLTAKIFAHIQHQDIDSAEKACLDFASEPVNKEHKIKALDAFASATLYHASSASMDRAEKAVRLALEMAPGTLTLKGTLGGILVEQGKFNEAEPLLRECLDRSPAYNDQGISSVYLGLIRLREAKIDEAKRLIKNGTTLYPEPWLLAKASALAGEHQPK